MKKYLYITFALFVALMSSCSETNEENTEFADWENRNNAYFNDVYAKAKAAISNGDTSWKIIRCYSKNEASTKPTDYIVAKVISEGKAPLEGQQCPLFSDSVQIHYRGYLMPTASYNTPVEGYPSNVGYQFDSSWTGNYNLATMVPTKGVTGSFVSGFTTALMDMRVGDRWLVYIPYDQAYGTSGNNSIPGYSTLLFDMTLSKFWKKRLK